MGVAWERGVLGGKKKKKPGVWTGKVREHFKVYMI